MRRRTMWLGALPFGLAVVCATVPASGTTALDAIADFGDALQAYQSDGREASYAHEQLEQATAALDSVWDDDSFHNTWSHKSSAAWEHGYYLFGTDYQELVGFAGAWFQYVQQGKYWLFFLGNQPHYTVPLGPVALTFHGAGVAQVNGYLPYFYLLGNYWESVGPNSSLVALSGWSPGVEWTRAGSIHPRDGRALLKGYLVRDVELAGEDDSLEPGCENKLTDAIYVYRYRYVPPNGGSTIAFHQSGGEQELWSYATSNCEVDSEPAAPTQFWSETGSIHLDLTNECAPVMTYSDGVQEQLNPAIDADVPPTTQEIAGPNGGPALTAYYPAFIYSAAQSCSTPTELDRTDANGNVTRFYSPDDYHRTMVDPRGRTTTVTFTSPDSGLTFLPSSVVSPGPGGVPETYTVSWSPQTVNFGTAMPDVACYSTPTNGATTGASCNGTYVHGPTIQLVRSIVLPDSRQYTFDYGSWGNVTQVTEPNGRVVTYGYGNASNSAYANASIGTQAITGPMGPYPTGQEVMLQGYGLTTTTEYPSGLSGSKYATTTSFSQRNVNTTACTNTNTTAFPCCLQVWRADTLPDGSVSQTGTCSFLLPQGALPAGHETWAAGATAPTSATYYASPTGASYYTYETDPSMVHIAAEPLSPLDARAVQVDSLKDGILTTATKTYLDTLIPAPGGITRNTTNITGTTLSQGGTTLLQTATTYTHYYAQNILRLSTSVRTMSGAGTIITRRDSSYDENTLASSSQPNLTTTMGSGTGCPAGLCRGNKTTSTTYLTPASAGGPIASKAYYFDNGAVSRTRNPVDALAGVNTTNVTAFNFGLCSASPTLTTTVVNALGQSVSTVTDCFAGSTLSSTDVNGQIACSQFDGLDRLVESAAPGDQLTTQAQCATTSSPTSCYVRDTVNCSASSGTVIGNNGAGPTTWTQYYPFGIGGVTFTGTSQPRTVVATRDGTTNGLQHVTFVDGLGRTIQQCSEVDPTTNILAGDGGASGDSAVCSTTVYDNMGRVSQQYVPFYAGTATAMPTAVAGYPSADQYTQTLYDALGRVTSARLMSSGAGMLPATTTAYSISGNDWLTTVTDANLCQVRTWTDALGHTVEHDVQNESALNGSGHCSGSPSWLTTTMFYDVAGRLLTVTDPASNHTTFAYDGLGRKTSMVDPDMGSWAYQYDGNGNLTQQTDARGAVINMHHDALNRVYLKDLPYWNVSSGQWVAGTPGEEDEYNYYDSASTLTGVDQGLPTTCYSCNDHCSSTSDTCDTNLLVCTHDGGTTGCPNQ
jgi:YD repeat-containing protein